MYKKSMGKDSHKQKYTEHTWFRERQPHVTLNQVCVLICPLEVYQLRV